jgi:hypothetical protein
LPNRFGGWLITNHVTNAATGQVYTGGDVIMVFLSVVMANFHLGQASPSTASERNSSNYIMMQGTWTPVIQLTKICCTT